MSRAVPTAQRSPDTVDRLLLAACVVIWLAVIGVAVAATVVLVDMGTSGQADPGGESDAPWLLYAVMGVSAVIIVGAIPLLLRARRVAQQEPRRPAPVARPRATAADSVGVEPSTEKLRVFGTVADPVKRNQPAYRIPDERHNLADSFTETADRVWLRATTLIVGAMGVSLLAVGAATYLMADDQDALSW